MSVEAAIKNSMMRMLRGYGIPAIEVTDYEELTESDGYCETCYYEYEVVRIDYLTETGEKKSYSWSGTFAELIREL